MLIASWKVRAGLPVALVLAWAGTAVHGDTGAGQNPVITSISAVQIPGQKFVISGTVADDTPGSCSVTLTGAANGTVSCNAQGGFSGTFDVPTLGEATAIASDGTGSSDPVSLTLSNAAPKVSCAPVLGAGNILTISGKVTDEAPAGLTVILSGTRAVNGLSAIVLANGTWSTVANIPAGTHGTITAKVTDWYGLTGTGSGAY
jgi:hypothetical protein